MSNSARQLLPIRKPKLMVVVPAYNEERNVTGVVNELKSLTLVGYDIEFVVIDDGSADRTRVVAQSAGAHVVSLPFNMGIGMSVQTGFMHAVSRGSDLVVQVDGDGQHIPNEISKLLAAVADGTADVVIGTRFGKGQKDGLEATTFMRWFVGRALSWTVKFLTGQLLTDTTSGFRVFNRKAAEFIAQNYPDDYPEVQVLVSLAEAGFKLAEVPVQMRPRMHGQSSINWWRSVYYVIKVVFACFLDKVRK